MEETKERESPAANPAATTAAKIEPDSEWTGSKTPFMSPAELEAYEKTTAALRNRTAAYMEDSKRLAVESDEMKKRTAAYMEDSKRLAVESDEMKKRRLEIEARAERMMQRGAKRSYQSEINSVAINVLVSILTKDALKGMRDSDFAQSPKLDISETVDFSLMVAKRYIDELHKIGVSQKQLEEYKEQIQVSVDLQQQGVPMPPPISIE